MTHDGGGTDDDLDDTRTSAVIPYRLAVWESPIGVDIAALEKLLPGSDVVREQAQTWQGLSGMADFWESGGITSGVQRDRCWELAGVIAAAGEQLALAHAAGIEAALWRESPPEQAGALTTEIGKRAMAELQSHYVLACGNAVVNVLARMLATREMLRERLAVDRAIESRFPPFSTHRDDWIMFGAPELQGLSRCVRGQDVEADIRLLLVPLRELWRSTEWQRLAERRGKDYHRWRPQTAGMAGIKRSSPWEGAMLAIGGNRPYTDADGLADETADTANAAMARLARGMEALLVRWWVVSPSLIGVTHTDDTTATTP